MKSTRHFIVKPRETKDKLKILKVAREKGHLTYKGKQLKRFLIIKYGGQNEVAQYFSGAERKKKLSTDTYTHQKYPSGMKGTSRHSHNKNQGNWENLSPADLP